MLKPLIISAPFGNWINHAHATSTLGTFTLKYRGGLNYRLWRMLMTLRYSWTTKSWRNKLGLPNPGLRSLSEPVGQHAVYYDDKIISIFGFNKDEWNELARLIADVYRPGAVELNLSCPNVAHPQDLLVGAMAAVDRLMSAEIRIIAKLPPVRWMNIAKPMYDYGVRTFHGCNTIQTPGGGWSGKVLKQYSLWCVEDLRQKWGDDITIIGGGGIDSEQDITDYKKAGADHCAVGSMLLNPFNWKWLGDLAAATSRKGKKQ